MSHAPEVFEITIAVKPDDIDELRHVNNVTYVRWIQDVAVAHWRAAARPEDVANVFWVVVRHEIDYKQPAFLGDEVVARTWVGAASRITFERFSEFRRSGDNTLLAKARTLWCPIDGNTGKLTIVSPEVRAHFSVPAAAPDPR